MGQKLLKCSPDGLDMAKKEKERMKLSQVKLAMDASDIKAGYIKNGNISHSTVKRFFQGEAINIESFKCICKVLGLNCEDIGVIVEKGKHRPNKEASPSRRGIAITGIFTSDQQLQLDAILENLRNLLLNVKVTYSEKSDANN
jgi:hypothetical protein